MIDDVLKQLFDSWNVDSKCGKCWKYVRTFNDYVAGTTNTFTPLKDGDECCTYVFLEGMETKSVKKDTDYRGMVLQYCDYFLHFKIVEQSDFQIQKGDEFHCNDGLFDRHVKPLIDCLGCDFESNLCEIDNSIEIFGEQTKPIFSFGDMNWAGIDYRLTIRKYNT